MSGAQPKQEILQVVSQVCAEENPKITKIITNKMVDEIHENLNDWLLKFEKHKKITKLFLYISRKCGGKFGEKFDRKS